MNTASSVIDLRHARAERVRAELARAAVAMEAVAGHYARVMVQIDDDKPDARLMVEEDIRRHLENAARLREAMTWPD